MASPATCAEVSASLGEPLAGTAPRAAAWLLLEQPGAWGAKALTESRLDPRLGAELERRAKAVHAKALLITRPGGRPSASRRAFVCSSAPGSSFVEELQLDDPAALLDLDLGAIAEGEPPRLGRPHEDALWLVCTNGRRDPCCARLGGPVARTLAGARADRVWRCSHLGGHRFAANLVCLPHGLCFGRVTPAEATALAEAIDRGELPVERLRGRSGLAPAAQAAEVFLRDELGVAGLDALTVEVAHGLETVFSLRDGRRFRVAVAAVAGPERPASCGEAPEPSERFEPAGIEALP